MSVSRRHATKACGGFDESRALDFASLGPDRFCLALDVCDLRRGQRPELPVRELGQIGWGEGHRFLHRIAMGLKCSDAKRSSQ